MQTGKIKWFDPKKGYGFITPDNPGPDTFVHCSSLRFGAKLNAGDAVEYETQNSPRGTRAVHVRLIQPVTAPTLNPDKL